MKLVHHVPIVHGAHVEVKVVYCEVGEEALFPSANQILTCPRNIDAARRDTARNDLPFLDGLRAELARRGFTPEEIREPTHECSQRAYFLPTPYVDVPLGSEVNVVVCPRQRAYGREKNWPYWKELADSLVAKGLKVVAVGSPDASDHRLEDSVLCTWRLERFLDASIAAMRAAAVVVATDSGLAHLAVWCAAPLLLVSYANGIVAPGPVREADGTIVREGYWPIVLNHYTSENHRDSPIRVLHNAWSDLAAVCRSVYSELGC